MNRIIKINNSNLMIRKYYSLDYDTNISTNVIWDELKDKCYGFNFGKQEVRGKEEKALTHNYYFFNKESNNTMEFSHVINDLNSYVELHFLLDINKYDCLDKRIMEQLEKNVDKSLIEGIYYMYVGIETKKDLLCFDKEGNWKLFNN